MIHPDKI